MDMLRFRNSRSARRGNPITARSTNPAEFDSLYAYSPYHNVKSGVTIPATLIMTSDHDDRVFPAHSFKFAAAMQHADPQGNPILLRVETRAGHGQGIPTAKLIERGGRHLRLHLACLRDGRGFRLSSAGTLVQYRHRAREVRPMNDPASRLPARMSTTMRISFMHDPHLRSIRFAAALLALGAFGVATAAPDSALKAAVADPGRTANFVARDTVRHPVEELSFFGIKPDMTVVELWPGGGYWTEILGPYLAKSGTYYVALQSTDDKEGNQTVSRWHSRIAAEKDRLGTIHETTLAAGHFDIAPPGSADLVLTFRNLHNWMDGGYARPSPGRAASRR